MAIDVVWFKRDLRTRDHVPLLSAILSGRPVLCLFILEPERFEQEDTDAIHVDWELDCAVDLSNTLRKSGSSLHIRIGNAIEVLENLDNEYGIKRILSHEETGNSWSYGRDKKVLQWCQEKEINWIEYPNNGVIRRLKNRDQWKAERDSRMRIPLNETPMFSKSIMFEGEYPSINDLSLTPRPLICRPEPGEDAALRRLHLFLDQDSKKYSWSISSPTLSTKHGSVLSPYLTTGVLSMRRVVQETNSKIKYLRKNKSPLDSHSEWIQSLSSFRQRLAWRCHFIQKLEMESNLDLVAQNPAIELTLDRKLDPEKFIRWKEGRTGWPFFDACMRQLTATGWINFRMRAMMMSAASYNLWLPWRDTGIFLAKQFLDYEPGIHWSQVGMQSGTTGINTIRAYSMTKQGKDHDPNGEYIRKWVPELSMVPTDFIHNPWQMPDTLQESIICRIGINYPEPIVNELVSRKDGISKSYSARTGEDARRISKKVLQMHGSRSRSRSRRNHTKKPSTVQKKLF
jgi:deoxyribodipyrimidine photo-lyase